MGIISCCTACVAKMALSIVNSVLFTVGLLLLIIGSLLHFATGAVSSWLSAGLQQIIDSDAGSAIGRQISLQELQLVLGNWANYLSYAGVLMLGFGILLVGLSIIGYVGFCCEIKVLVMAYAVVTGAFTAACLGVLISYAVHRAAVYELGKTEMLRLLREKYKGRQNANEFTDVFDLIQIRLPCCGVQNFTDFYIATQWNRTYQDPDTGSVVTLQVPVSCCKISSATLKPDFANCTSSPDQQNSNLLAGGCYPQLWRIFDAYSAYAMVGLGVAAFVTACMLLLTILVLCNMFE